MFCETAFASAADGHILPLTAQGRMTDREGRGAIDPGSDINTSVNLVAAVYTEAITAVAFHRPDTAAQLRCSSIASACPALASV